MSRAVEHPLTLAFSVEPGSLRHGTLLVESDAVAAAREAVAVRTQLVEGIPRRHIERSDAASTRLGAIVLDHDRQPTHSSGVSTPATALTLPPRSTKALHGKRREALSQDRCITRRDGLRTHPAMPEVCGPWLTLRPLMPVEIGRFLAGVRRWLNGLRCSRQQALSRAPSPR